jgi:hypothetical protein
MAKKIGGVHLQNFSLYFGKGNYGGEKIYFAKKVIHQKIPQFLT